MAADAPLFARQPIFDTHKNVVAYELLFRHSDANYCANIDGDHASSHVLLNSFGTHKLESVIGEHKAFINFTRNLLISPPDLPREKVVIEVLEDISADQEVVDGLKKLKDSGYDIALDDFFINRDTVKMLHYANIVKVDVLALKESQVVKIIERLKPMQLTLLAEKIEDYAMLEHCKRLGFDLFQGYFLCKPEIVRGVKISANKSAILRLISTLQSPKSSHNEIVTAISRDAGLSYKILKLVNSAAVGLTREIDSLSQAVTLLGLDKIKNWASYILMASNGDKPKELCIITMCRAKMCEYMGLKLYDQVFAQKCFTVGLLSSLDSFLNTKMEDLVAELQLSESVNNALLTGAGDEGLILEIARSFERGDWNDIDWKTLKDKKISDENLNDWYLASISWAVNLVQNPSAENDVH